jgi:O-methyltransferase involved in polyketide biosynthesis
LQGTRKQVVSFGAGFDTSYFFFANETSKQNDPNDFNLNFKFFELDFENVVIRKKEIIQNNNQLKTLIKV